MARSDTDIHKSHLKRNPYDAQRAITMNSLGSASVLRASRAKRLANRGGDRGILIKHPPALGMVGAFASTVD